MLVNIKKGRYRLEWISGTFELIEGYKVMKLGGEIKIHNPNAQPPFPTTQRIKVEPGDFEILSDNGDVMPGTVGVNTAPTLTQRSKSSMPSTCSYEAAFAAVETKDEALDRIRKTFDMLDKITLAAANGIVRGVVVSGPPGVGKSFGVEKQLGIVNAKRISEGKEPMFNIISGGVSPIGLYQKLYHSKAPKQVLVFDDADGVLEDSEMLNLLKAALNSGDRRKICWNKESTILEGLGIPKSFDFEGSVLFLSNKDFVYEIQRNSRIAVHLEAIMSRCHYLDLEVGSMRDKLLRIEQVVIDGMLAPFEFTSEQERDVISFVVDNAEYMREVSLRAVKKVADWVKADPISWYELSEATLLTKEAYFKRMLEKRNSAVIVGELVGDEADELT